MFNSLQSPATAGRAQDVTPAPRLRRALAFCTDICLTAIIAVVAATPLQVFWPPDIGAALLFSIAVGTSVGFLYLGFGPRLLGNTLGKWLFSLKLVSLDGEPITKANLTRRLLTVGLWPVNALMVLMRRSRAHLGDDWARTAVILSAPKRGLGLCMLAAVVVLVCAFQLGTFSSRVAVVRSDAWLAAKAKLAEETDAKVPLLPAWYSIFGRVAMFHADGGHGLRRLVVVQRDDHWHVTDDQPAKGWGTGGSIDPGPQKTSVE